MDLTAPQISLLQHLHALHYEIVAFPMYASHIGIRRARCAALLTPIPSGTFTLFGAPTYMLNENLAVLIHDGPSQFFVWKKERLEATPARLQELATFTSDLSTALLPRT